MPFVRHAQKPAEEAAEAYLALSDLTVETLRNIIEALPPEQKASAEKSVPVIVEVNEREAKLLDIAQNIRVAQAQVEALAKPLSEFVEKPVRMFFEKLFAEIVPEAKSISDSVKEKIKDGAPVVANVVNQGKSVMRVMRVTQVKKTMDWEGFASSLGEMRTKLDVAVKSGSMAQEAYDAVVNTLNEMGGLVNRSSFNTYRILFEKGEESKIPISTLIKLVKQLSGPSKKKSAAAVEAPEAEALAQEIAEGLTEAMEQIVFALQIADSTMTELLKRLEQFASDTESVVEAATDLQSATGG